MFTSTLLSRLTQAPTPSLASPVWSLCLLFILLGPSLCPAPLPWIHPQSDQQLGLPWPLGEHVSQVLFPGHRLVMAGCISLGSPKTDSETGCECKQFNGEMIPGNTRRRGERERANEEWASHQLSLGHLECSPLGSLGASVIP